MSEPTKPDDLPSDAEPDPLDELAKGQVPVPKVDWRVSPRAACIAASVVGVVAGIAVWIWAPDPPWWIPPFIALITAVMAYRLIRPVWRAAGLEDEI